MLVLKDANFNNKDEFHFKKTHLSTEAKAEILSKAHRHSQTYNLAKLVLKSLMQI